MARNRQESWLLEEILGVIDGLFILLNGNFVDWFLFIRQNGGHLEHFTSTFAIRGRDNRCMDIQEASALEEQVSRQGQVVSNSRNSPNEIGSWSQMGNVSQSLRLDMLSCQGVIFVVTITMHFDKMVLRANVHFDQLALCGTLDEFAFDLKGGTYSTFQNLFEVGDFLLNDN